MGVEGGDFSRELLVVVDVFVEAVLVLLFDEREPPADPFAVRGDQLGALLCANPENWRALKAMPEGANSVEWPIEQTRANEAAARYLWPLGNTKLEKRLGLITAPTLLLWGEQDRVMPPSYAQRFAAGIAGRCETRIIANAGHLAELDQPAAVAAALLEWTR